MTTTRTSKLWPRPVRNMIRSHKLNNYGWACFGAVMSKDRSEFWIKRSNWIYNLVHHGIKFKGTK